MRIAPFAASLLAASVLLPTAALAQAPGAVAPAFTLTDTSGKAVQLADYRGKFVVLEWTNPECPFVRKHYTSGNMQDLQKAVGRARRRLAVDQLDERRASRSSRPRRRWRAGSRRRVRRRRPR